MRKEWFIGWMILIVLLMGTSVQAGVVEYDGSVLPSADGWDYVDYNGTVETDVFSASGGVLVQNTMGTGFVHATIYRITGPVNSVCMIDYEIRTRVTQNEVVAPSYAGFAFYVATPTHVYVVQISPTEIRFGYTLLTTTIDNTTFHNYRAEINPVSTEWSVFVDEVLVGSGIGAGTNGTGVGYVAFGDWTGAANAAAEVDWLRFDQAELSDCSVPSEDSTWGAIKALYD